MEMEDRDFVTFTDDDGKEFELDVVEYFEYEGDQYAILMDLSCECEENEECECEHDVYIMKMVVEGDEENFVPPDDDKFDQLAAIAEKLLNEDCDCDCDCEDGECDCDCGDEGCEHEGCNCGCHHEDK